MPVFKGDFPKHGPTGDDVASGGEPPYDDDMNTRLTTLEARFDTILPTLATKTDIESIKGEIHKSSGETHKWMLATVIGLFLGFGGLFLAMSNALKPAATPAAVQQAPSQPITIYTQPVATSPAIAQPAQPTTHK